MILQVGETAGYNLTPEVSVRRPDGRTVVAEGTGSSVLLEFEVPGTEVYTIRVTDSTRTRSGNYSLTLVNLTRGPLTSSGDRDGGEIQSGQTIAASLGVSDLDVYQFTAQAGDRVILQVGETAGYNMTPDVEVRAPDLTTIVADDTASRVILEFDIDQTGTYTIVQRHDRSDHPWDSTGNYNLTLVNLTRGPLTSSGDGDGGEIQSGRTIAASLGVSDLDVYRFTAQAGDRVILQVGETAGYNMTPDVEVRAPDLKTVIADDKASSVILEFDIDETGTYTIVQRHDRTDHPWDSTGNYNLTFVNLTRGPLTASGDRDGGEIQSGQTISASLGVSDLDVYQFTAYAGDRVILQVGETAGYNMTPDVEVRTPNLKRVLVSDKASSVILEFDVDETGTYTIVQRHDRTDHPWDSTGNYNLTLVNLTRGPLTSSGDGDGGEIQSGQTIAASLGVSDLDVYRFTAQAGDRMILQVGETAGYNMTPDVEVRTPNLKRVLVSDKASSVILEFDIDETGTYTIVQRHDRTDHPWDSTGNYNLTLVNLTRGSFTSPRDTDGGQIQSGQTISASLGVSDLDVYRFTAQAGDRIILQVGETAGYNMTPDVEVRATDLKTVLASDTASGVILEFDIDETGTYTIVQRHDRDGPSVGFNRQLQSDSRQSHTGPLHLSRRSRRRGARSQPDGWGQCDRLRPGRLSVLRAQQRPCDAARGRDRRLQSDLGCRSAWAGFGDHITGQDGQ